MSANFAFPNSFDPRALATASPATASPATASPATARARGQHPEAIRRGASGPEPRFAEQFQSFVDSNAQLARRAAKETGDHARTRPEARTKDAAKRGPAKDDEEKTSKRSNSVRRHPLWNPMWHAIPVAGKALPANISATGASRTGFEIPQGEGGAAQGDTFSADANLLTAPLLYSGAAAETTEGLSTGRSGWSGRGAENLPLGASNLSAVMAVSLTVVPNLSSVASQSVTGVDQGGEKMPKTTGFTLDSREWLRAEQGLPSMEIPPALTAIDGVCVSSPVAHLTVAQPVPQPVAQPVPQTVPQTVPQQLASAPAPTFTGRALLRDGQEPSLAGGHVERELPGKGAMQDPLSFVVRLAGEPSQVAVSRLDLAKLREPEPVVALATSLLAPGDALPLQRATETAFDRAGKEPGPNEPRTGTSESGKPESGKPESGKPESGKPESGTGNAQLIAAYESSPGGQRDDGEPLREPALASQGPRSSGDRDFSSWVPGFGAEVAGRPSPHPDGSGPGAKTGKQVEAAIEPELAPERLSAAPRQLVLTIPSGSDGEGVLASVHVRSHNGGVEIAVRTPDAQLSSSLQESLPELVARLETQGTGANVARGDQLSNGGPADGSGMRDGQSQDGQSQDWQPGEEPRGGGRDERQQHPEDRGQPRGQPGTQIRELRQQRQARWQASLGLAPR